MKKLLTTLTLFAVLTLTSCGGANNGSNSGSQSSTPAHVHTFDESKWESDGTQHWHPATCEHTAQKGSKANHEFSEVAAESVAATCSAQGKKVEVCSVCGYKKETPIDKLPHTYQEVPAEYVEPTCSVPGKKVEVCSVCGDRKETPLTAEHDLQPYEYAQGEGAVAATVQKCSRDNHYEIDFNAFDAAATFSVSTDRHSNYVKLSKQVAADGSGSASTVEYKFYSPFAMKGRFWLNITGNTSNYWSRDTKSGNQALFYTYDDTTTNINTWKNEVKLNDAVIDFDNATYNVKGEDIKFAELVYDDFGTLASNTGTPIAVPMPEVEINEGLNVLVFKRLTGYAFNMHTISFKGETK